MSRELPVCWLDYNVAVFFSCSFDYLSVLLLANNIVTNGNLRLHKSAIAANRRRSYALHWENYRLALHIATN